VSSPNEERAFRQRHASHTYAQRVRPFGFVSTCRPNRLEGEASGIRTPVAPFAIGPQARMSLEWWTATTRLDTATGYDSASEPLIPGEVCVESHGDYFTEYASHPEAKAAAPDG